MLSFHLHVQILGQNWNSLSQNVEVVVVSHNFWSVFENFVTLLFKMHIWITLITSSKLLHWSYIISEVFSYILYLLFKVLSHIAQLLFESFNNPLFVKFVFIFKFSDLSFDNCNCLLNLVVWDLSNENLHFLFDFRHELSFFLPIHTLGAHWGEHEGHRIGCSLNRITFLIHLWRKCNITSSLATSASSSCLSCHHLLENGHHRILVAICSLRHHLLHLLVPIFGLLHYLVIVVILIIFGKTWFVRWLHNVFFLNFLGFFRPVNLLRLRSLFILAGHLVLTLLRLILVKKEVFSPFERVASLEQVLLFKFNLLSCQLFNILSNFFLFSFFC